MYDTESRRVDCNCKYSIFAAQRRHKIAPEYKFLAHSLNEKSKEIQSDDAKVYAAAQVYAVCAGKNGKKSDGSYKNGADTHADQIVWNKPAFSDAHCSDRTHFNAAATEKADYSAENRA